MNRVGLVLGGGGLTGEAFHAGVLDALHEVTGWDPRRAEIIVGTSAGSVVGTYLRLGVDTVDLAAHLLGVPTSESASAIFDRMGPEAEFLPDGPRTWPRLPQVSLLAGIARGRVMPGAFLASVLPEGRVPTEPWARRIHQAAGKGWPTEQLLICALRRRDGHRVVFGRPDAPTVDVADAIAASCAIPTFFRPVEIKGEHYVDGGAHSPTNADVLRHEALDLVIVSAPMSTSRRVVRMNPDQGVRWGHRLQLTREAARLRRAGIPVVAFQPDGGDIAAMCSDAMSARRVGAVVQRVRASVAERLRAGAHREALADLDSAA